MPLLSQLFRVCSSGDYASRADQGLISGGKTDLAVSPVSSGRRRSGTMNSAEAADSIETGAGLPKYVLSAGFPSSEIVLQFRTTGYRFVLRSLLPNPP